MEENDNKLKVRSSIIQKKIEEDEAQKKVDKDNLISREKGYNDKLKIQSIRIVDEKIDNK